MDVKKLVETLNKLSRIAEDNVDEIVLQDEIEPEKPAEVVDPVDTEAEPTFNDTMSLADQFDAKARIARALEALKAAVEEFKDATSEKIDLLKDEALLQGIANLDDQVGNLEKALVGGSNILGNSELNDPFRAEEEPATEEPIEETPEEETEDEAEDGEEDEEDEADFDAEAGLDLFAHDENNDEE